MADATRLQTLSKQSDEQRQATEVITTQIEKRTQSQAQIDELIQSHQRMEAMMAAFMSQRSSQLGRPPDRPYSASGDLTSYSQAPQPPDPPDIRKSRQDLTIKAPDPLNFNQSELISTIQTPNKLTLRYSCEEIHERMTNGLCIFCEELDTPGHYNLKHKRSKLCLVECVDDGFPDVELVEPAVEEISNKSVNMIREKEPSPENESRPEVSVSQFQVPLSSMEPSRRCCNDSLDVVDEDMCDEPVCGKDGDYTLTVSAKFCEIDKDPRFELVCLKQSCDPVDFHLDIFESALTRSSLRHTPTYQYGAPFSPYQNCNDTGHYKREFGNYSEPGIELDRASEEVEDDELQDKQPEEDYGEIIAEGTAIELVVESGYKLFKKRSLNRLLLQESQIILLHFEGFSDTTIPCLYLETKALSSQLSAGGIMLLSDSKQQPLLDPYADLPCSWHILSDLSYAGCIVALLMVYDAERLIQSNAPPVFSDLLCAMNRIQKHHNKWGILTGTEIFSYNGVIIQVMVQRQWETFVMMLLSIAGSLILLSAPFIFAEKKGIEISISCCYGTSSVMQFSTAFEIMSKQQRFIQLPNLPRESSHDDADRILQKREEHITSSTRNVVVTKALIQWKEHPPDQIKDSQMYVLVSENQCQDYSPLLFLERVKDSFEFMLRVEHFENPLVSILTQEVFHLQRPPEISTKCSSPNILNFILEDKDVLKREVL